MAEDNHVPTEKSDETIEDQSTSEPTVATESTQWKENARAAQAENRERFGRLKDFFRGYWGRKKWTLPVTLLALLIIVLAVPLTRYAILGLFIKHDVAVTAVDSITGKPVSGAEVSAEGLSAETGANGLAKLHLAVGPHKFTVSKHYYKSASVSRTVTLFGQQAVGPLQLKATGRQVPISVVNKITGKGLANVSVVVLGTTSKTDKDGKAVVVLPTTSDTEAATLEAVGFNKASVSIQVTDQDVPANKFSLSPGGQIYFLSNLSGKIDVVKANLDGTGRETVLAGTGKEDAYSTALLASPDWKYLMLLSKRGGSQGIYLITTANDQVVNIDSGNGSTAYIPVGWSGDTFIYEASHSNVQSWQAGASVLKSYAADSGRLYSIDQTQGEGTDQSDYAYTSFGAVSILSDELVYARSWYGTTSRLTGKSDNLISVNPDGSGKKTIKDFPVPSTAQFGYTLGTEQFEPNGVYVQVPNGDNANTYYEYESGTLNQVSTITDDSYNKPYPTYLVSPANRQAFWSDVRDNKNTLFVGSAAGTNPKQIAMLSDFTPYGWYTDNYLLVSKGGSVLYIMPADGSSVTPLKITDYYKPQVSFRGYGGF